MASTSEVYRSFPVIETVDLVDYSCIGATVKKMVDAYIMKTASHEFSYRLLLPREDNSTTKAKKIGLQVQAYFLLSLRARNAKPNLKDVRYLHDSNHYGWLLVDPIMFDKCTG
ncbi:hypothetical protein [Nitrososphaera sp. AFS]|jgi:hypothetical protein|uniref:hypothetical protein n=1 Tax=Nitrososphaera sp. AFS TaxID=2301191 RepID=UPI0013922E1C|nr:hypothetical protein [Nitrososphaera sp. AFS]NAL77737.1 hypothetical protein [Nitrososphaera sp. AFS]